MPTRAASTWAACDLMLLLLLSAGHRQRANCAASSCLTFSPSFAMPACRARGMTVRWIGLTSCQARRGGPTSSWTTTLPPARSESSPVTASICNTMAVCSALQRHDKPARGAQGVGPGCFGLLDVGPLEHSKAAGKKLGSCVVCFLICNHACCIMSANAHSGAMHLPSVRSEHIS